ncbi:hypothetical protein D049_4646B, partial [Vibrio parahaemolyticus VPTS-2010]
EVSLNR